MISFDMGLDELFDDTDEIDKIISQNVASSNNNANAHEAAQFAL